MRQHGWFRPHVRGLTAISSTTLREGVGVRIVHNLILNAKNLTLNSKNLTLRIR